MRNSAKKKNLMYRAEKKFTNAEFLINTIFFYS